MKWMEKLDESTKEHLTLRIKETHFNEEALKVAEDQQNAQLWIAIANLSKQMNEIILKLNYIERALQEQHINQMKTTSKQDIEEINKAMQKVMRSRKK
mgnify:FL=1